MKANELMIGDWVFDKAVSDKPVQVEQINEQNVHYKRGNGYMSAGVELLEPIPLTKEILEKNGFEEIGDDIYQLEEKPNWFWVDFYKHEYGCEHDISTYEYEDSERRLKKYGIPFVHELQNAMRECEIEKEIEL